MAPDPKGISAPSSGSVVTCRGAVPCDLNTAYHVPLDRLNTMHVQQTAHCLLRVSETDLGQLPRNVPLKVLGSGSNVLLTQDVEDCMVLQLSDQAIRVLSETSSHVSVEADGGCVWHDLVTWSLDRGYFGLENLSLIPGTVGAAPVQNIGAYGVEQSDCMDSLIAFDLRSFTFTEMSNADCRFGYRTSVFKEEQATEQGQPMIITRVRYRLHKDSRRVNTCYGAIQKVLAEKGMEASPQGISKAVIAIRKSRLPDPAEMGSCGSFFRNPLVDAGLRAAIQARCPGAPFYSADSDAMTKIPAGWLIEQCGWRGKVVGRTGCYDQNAAVIVNFGGASGAEIWAHAQAVADSVAQRFGVLLSPEVNIW